MINKRPFPDEDLFEFSRKLPKQWEYHNHLALPSNDVRQNPQNSGEHSFSKCHDQERFASKSNAEVSNGTDNEFEIGTSGCVSQFWWASGSIVEEDANSDAALHLSLFPEYFAPGHQIRTLLHSDEIYSSLLDHSPLKPVSIGPEYQADVPEWGLQGSKNNLDNQVELVHSLDSGRLVDDGDEEKLMGTCVIPMPDFEASGSYYSAGKRWTGNDCECLDRGSIRCVRQHVMEAREKLREDLGPKIFEELGFCEMGEGVSDKWTEEEEQTFHGIVFTNPVSMGKNFWDHLSVAFSSQTKKDIVSYYFNVFMLRKRAEQNRFDPVNIDSDNDEWQRSEVGMEEEDEDSGVESLDNQFAPAYYQEDDADDCDDDIEGEYEVDDCQDGANVVATDEEDRGDVDDLLGPDVSNSFADSAGGTCLQLLSKIQNSNQQDYDIQDDSCTSYEYQQDKVDCCGPLVTGCDDAKPSSQGSD
ncbi:hypothetical protein ACOSP7_028097 [Xanthoceras sorbifolium]|uniref:Myb-like domain-containing protein n=1 Tax=Xanthoceras sorbifolium TaxID=99658 RepID=A0ABQ8HDC9_9ROSI|nr:hypothetical protein JRO89_XS12G0228400 [Xanthoceras sorbifolium]